MLRANTTSRACALNGSLWPFMGSGKPLARNNDRSMGISQMLLWDGSLGDTLQVPPPVVHDPGYLGLALYPGDGEILPWREVVAPQPPH